MAFTQVCICRRRIESKCFFTDIQPLLILSQIAERKSHNSKRAWSTRTSLDCFSVSNYSLTVAPKVIKNKSLCIIEVSFVGIKIERILVSLQGLFIRLQLK